MANLILPYEYFSGANVVLSIEDFPVSQAAGFSMQIQESKVPIYGYSSRHFDAIARGRVLVSGTLIINYVHHDYLFELIQMALQANDPVLGVSIGASDNGIRDALSDPSQVVQAIQLLYADYVSNAQFPDYLREKYWDNPTAPDTELGIEQILSPNPHDSFGGLTIDVTFGERYSFWGHHRLSTARCILPRQGNDDSD